MNKYFRRIDQIVKLGPKHNMSGNTARVLIWITLRLQEAEERGEPVIVLPPGTDPLPATLEAAARYEGQPVVIVEGGYAQIAFQLGRNRASLHPVWNSIYTGSLRDGGEDWIEWNTSSEWGVGQFSTIVLKQEGVDWNIRLPNVGQQKRKTHTGKKTKPRKSKRLTYGGHE